MKPTTRQLIELALASDNTVAPEAVQVIEDVLAGKDVESGSVDGPLLLTMTAAAKLLGVSRVSLWRLVKQDVVRTVEIMPGVFRVRRADVLELGAKYAEYRPSPRGPRRKR